MRGLAPAEGDFPDKITSHSPERITYFGADRPISIDVEILGSPALGAMIIGLTAEADDDASRAEPGKTVFNRGIKTTDGANSLSQPAVDASRFSSRNIRTPDRGQSH